MTKWGMIGLDQYAFDYVEALALSRNGKLIAISSNAKEYIDNVKRLYPDLLIYTDFKDIFNNRDIDALYIGLNGQMHLEYTLKALKQKIPVISRITAVSTIEEFDEIAQCSKENQVLYLEGTRTRFLPSYQQLLKDILYIGDILKINCNVNELKKDDSTYFMAISFAMGLINSTLVSVDLTYDKDLEMISLLFRSGATLEIERSHVDSNTCKIIGSKGSIILSDYIDCDSYTIFVTNNTIRRHFDVDNDLVGVVDAVDVCRSRGYIEYPYLTHEDTREIIRVMNEIDKELENE